MKVISLLVVLFAIVGCDLPERENYDFMGSPVDLRARGYDYDLRLALRLGLSGKDAVRPATKCPSVFVDVFSPLETSIECGSLRVPQDHDDLSSEPMTLGYFKSPAVFDPTKPLLVIEQGGPGSSSMMLAVYYLLQEEELSNSFNILAIEQRGTEWTFPDVTCPDAIVASQESKSLKHDVVAKLENTRKANEKCLKRVSSQMDLSKISSYQIAKDIVFGAKEMGFDKFNYYGVSYGAVVGQYLLHFAPEKLNNIVLDSPAVVGDPWIEDSIEAKDIYYKRKFEKFVNINRPEVGFESAMSHLKKAAQKFDDTPFDVEVTIDGITQNHSVNKDYFMDMILSSLRTEDFMIITKLLEAADKLESNPRYAKVIFEPLLYFYLKEDSEEVTTTTIMYEKIICREFSYDSLDVNRAISTWTFFPEVLTEKNLNSLTEELDMCSLNLKKDENHIILSQPIQTDKPVLVVGGENDTTTIPRYVTDVALNMPNAHKKVYDGLEHGVFAERKCVSQGIVNYLKSTDGSFTDECEKTGSKDLERSHF